MDHFGIGIALQGMAGMFFQMSRRTGRTTSLLESLRHGDRVVCVDTRQAWHMERACKERELDVTIIVVSPSSPERLFERPTSEGRTVFDHTWVELFYFEALTACARELDKLQRESSGYGTAHIETRRAFAERARWGKFSPPHTEPTEKKP
jgi:hypothetical protein